MEPTSEQPPLPASAPPPGWAEPLPAASGIEPSTPTPAPRKPRSNRPLLWLGAATIVALAAFALISLRGGGSGGSTGPFSPVAEAAQRTAAVPGARVSGSGTVSGGGASVSMQFSGEYSGDDQRSAMRMDMRTNVPLPAAAQITPMYMVSDGLTMYMNAPVFASQLPDGKSWMKIDMSEVAGDIETEQSATDARAMLDQLEAAGEVVEIGRERVQGATTTHYTATVSQPGGETASSDVWVDRRGYVRRVAMAVPFESVGGPGAQMSMTMDYFDFGADPEIALPPEEETYDATELALEGAEAALGSAG